MLRAHRQISGLYVILDAEAVAQRGLDLIDTARATRRAGVRLLQYRDKNSASTSVLRNARAIREVFAGEETVLILNDHAELVRSAQFHGVHLGQGDLSPDKARAVLGEDALIGLSTHTVHQAAAAEEQGSVDYVAIGPIFPTPSKKDPDPVVGLDVLRRLRSCVSKPLVAIGGISEANLRDVFAGGADAAAVIGAMFEGGRPVADQLGELLRKTPTRTGQSARMN